MKIKEFYLKHQDTIELTKAYIGVIILSTILIYDSVGMPGINGEQLYYILRACDSGALSCPF